MASILPNCLSCGRITSLSWDIFIAQLDENAQHPDAEVLALEATGLRRACCRGMLLQHLRVLRAEVRTMREAASKKSESERGYSDFFV